MGIIGKILLLAKSELILLRNAVHNRVYSRVYISPKNEKLIVDQFHRLYYDSYMFNRSWDNTNWLGARVMKTPLDLWIYQEIIHEQKPDVIIECGTDTGGSALYLANICDLINKGKIITIDIEDRKGKPRHPRITYLTGSSTSDEIVAKVKGMVGREGKVLVILDSDHSKGHVLNELRIYSKIVTKGSYLIVEDSNLNGHPVSPDFGPGPMEAIQEFFKENRNFVIDKKREKFYLTFNPNGYLKRVK